MALFSYLKSTILNKIVMAVTGVMQVLFVIGHTVGNMQVYLGPEALNTYAHFLQSLGEGLWIIRIVMGVAIILHILSSIILRLRNNSAKPVKYQVTNYVRATLTSRTMLWTGLMIVSFILFHLFHFTTGDIDPENFAKNNPEYYSGDIYLAKTANNGEMVPLKSCCDSIMKDYSDGKIPHSHVSGMKHHYNHDCSDQMKKDRFDSIKKSDCRDGKVPHSHVSGMKHHDHDSSDQMKKGHFGDILGLHGKPQPMIMMKKMMPSGILYERPDVYYMMIKGFNQPWISLIYIFGVILLGFHLNHAIQSMIQTLGLNHPKYFNFFVRFSTLLSIIIVLCLISIPITIITGLVGGGL